MAELIELLSGPKEPFNRLGQDSPRERGTFLGRWCSDFYTLC